MKKYRIKGSITVFLSLLSILVLACIFAVIESARVRGAKTQSASITGLGTFSLMGEYENQLLDDFDIFALDGAYGSGNFDINNVNDKLSDYLSYNVKPGKDLMLNSMYMDPWNLELEKSEVTEYALLTDNAGEALYQQAVAYMRDNGAALAIDALAEMQSKITDTMDQKEDYEAALKDSRQEMAEAKEMQQQYEEEQRELAEQISEATGETVEYVPPAKPKVKNPLPAIEKLRKKSLETIILSGKKVSDKNIDQSKLPSKKIKNKGTMKLEKQYSGIINNLLFREYLLLHLSNYLSADEKAPLQYQVEYILGGKKSDQKNLEKVALELLAVREGLNLVVCMTGRFQEEATTFAALVSGGGVVVPLYAAVKYGLILAWTFGESLIDVRTLFDGGKVPLIKTEAQWNLSIENLGNIVELITSGKSVNDGTGLKYTDYLRILLEIGSLKKQKLRALDLLQLQLQSGDNKGFKAENCIVAVRTKVQYQSRPVFYSLPQRVFGARFLNNHFIQECSFSY